MQHYHTITEQLGPLVHLWSMRFEAKHRIFKTAANTTSNRRNICMSLAIKHQLQLNDMFLKGTLSNDIESGPSNNIICDSDVKHIKKFLEIDSLDSLFCYSWISVKAQSTSIKWSLL